MTATLCSTEISVDRDRSPVHKHQKLLPTIGDRLTHIAGTTGSRALVQIEFDGLSGLTCTENGNPLLQYAVAKDYHAVHAVSWPQFLSYDVDASNLTDVVSKAVARSVGICVINSGRCGV